MNPLFIPIFTFALVNIGSVIYILKTLKGEVRPNRITWFLWGVIPIIAYSIQSGENTGLSSLFTLAVGIGPLLIFCATFFNTKSYWKINRVDLICLSASILSIVLWISTKNPLLALSLSIGADFLAGVPTLIKSYRDPESENYLNFLFGAIAAILTLTIIGNWNFLTYGFAVFILGMNVVITFLLLVRPSKFFHSRTYKL